MPTPTPETVVLAFPVVADASVPGLAAAVLRALVFVFVMVLVHSLYGLAVEWRSRELLQNTEDFLIVLVFCAFHFLLILLPDRTDLPAAVFGLWFLVFIVRSLLRNVINLHQ